MKTIPVYRHLGQALNYFSCNVYKQPFSNVHLEVESITDDEHSGLGSTSVTSCVTEH